MHQELLGYSSFERSSLSSLTRKDPWDELKVKLADVSPEEAEKFGLYESYTIDKPRPVPIRSRTISFINLSLHVNLPLLYSSTQKDMQRFVFSLIARAANSPIDILSASLSPMEGALESFAALLKGAIKRGCKVRLVMADPNSSAFAFISSSESSDSARIRSLQQLLKPLIGPNLEIHLVDTVFHNSTYRFGDLLLFLMGADSVSTAILLDPHVRLFSSFERQLSYAVDLAKKQKEQKTT